MTGKINMTHMSDKCFMSYWNINDKETYVISPTVPGLMKYDWEKNLFSSVAMFPDNCCDASAYAVSVLYENKVICFPTHTSNVILIFDIEKEEFKQVVIDFVSSQDGAKIFNVYWYREHLYCVLYGSNQIMEFDPVNEIILDVLNFELRDFTFVSSTCVAEKIYLTTSNSAELVSFSMRDKNFNLINLHSKIYSFRVINNIGDSLILGGYKKEIYKLNLNTLKLDVKKLPSWVNDSGRDDYFDYEFFCTDIFTVCDKLCFLSLHEPGIFVYDIYRDELKLINLPELDKDKENVKSYTRLFLKDDRFAMLYSLVDDRMIQVDIKDGTYVVICPQIEDIVWNWMGYYGLYDDVRGMEIFLHSLGNNHVRSDIELNNNVGQKIWDYLTKEIKIIG